MKNNAFILMVGRSGSGKDCVAQGLTKLFGYSQVKSYTTRPKRFPEENTHIFISNQKIRSAGEIPSDAIAMTEFDGYFYWATKQQIEENDIYVIDISGIEYFLDHYDGEKKIIICYIECEPGECFTRMLDRGDKIDQVIGRMRNDEFEFGREALHKLCNEYEVHKFYNGKGARLPAVVDAIDRLVCSQKIHST